MESSLLTGDFVTITLIVIIFASSSSSIGKSSLAKQLDKIEERLKELRKPSHVAAITNHLTEQVAVPRRAEFQEELQALMRQYIEKYDDEYAWE